MHIRSSSDSGGACDICFGVETDMLPQPAINTINSLTIITSVSSSAESVDRFSLIAMLPISEA